MPKLRLNAVFLLTIVNFARLLVGNLKRKAKRAVASGQSEV